MLIFNCFKPPKVLNIKVLIKDTGGGQRNKGRGLKEENEQKEKGQGIEWPFRLRIAGSQLVLTSRPSSLLILCGSLVISKASLNFLLK